MSDTKQSPGPGRWENLDFDLTANGIKYWLERRKSNGRIYVRWYESRTGEISGRSLATTDLELAKVKLAADVLAGRVGAIDSGPEDVLVVALFRQYWDEVAEKGLNPREFIRPGEYFLDYAGNDVRVGKVRQRMIDNFARELSEERSLSVSSIERYLAMVHAPIQYAINRTEDDLEERGGIALSHAPRWKYSRPYLSELLGKPEPEPRDFVAPVQMLAAFIDAIEEDHLFRYMLLALSTWARPAAVLDLQRRQLNLQMGLANLLPKGRRQNKKVRPVVPLPPLLEPWLVKWAEEDQALRHDFLIHWRGEPVQAVRSVFETTAKRAGCPELYPYALRHTMATNATAAGVARDEVSAMLGHIKPEGKTSAWYIHAGPNHLRAARDFTETFIREISSHCRINIENPPAAIEAGPHLIEETTE